VVADDVDVFAGQQLRAARCSSAARAVMTHLFDIDENRILVGAVADFIVWFSLMHATNATDCRCTVQLALSRVRRGGAAARPGQLCAMGGALASAMPVRAGRDWLWWRRNAV
jgi:hypothetical protein